MISSARSLAYRTFYRLPGRWRRRLVRTAVQKYIIGAVVLLYDADTDTANGADRDSNGSRRLLLIKQPPGFGWNLPAGLMDRGEYPAEAAARELREETGIHLAPEDMTPASPNAIVHTSGRWVDVVFTAQTSAATATLIVDGGEVIEAGWHRLDALPPLTVPTARVLAHYGIGPYQDYPEVTRGRL
jgi:8-oxo-dGTP pyrophosphatase MutT (NUDIX family)